MHGCLPACLPLLPVALSFSPHLGLRVVIAVGLQHGTITAVVNGTTFEITTLRVDAQTDGMVLPPVCLPPVCLLFVVHGGGGGGGVCRAACSG